MRNGIFAASLALIVVGCAHSQVPPSPPPNVGLTWTAPANCSSCTYVISRATATTSCPTSGYTPLNQSSPASGTSYTDSAPPTGVSVCYVAQAVLSGATGQPSAPSNGGTPLAVPLYPGTPGSPNATAVAELAPPIKTDAKPTLVVSFGCDVKSGYCGSSPLYFTQHPVGSLTATLVKK